MNAEHTQISEAGDGRGVKEDEEAAWWRWISIDHFVGFLARVTAFINRYILRYAQATQPVTGRRTWWLTCAAALICVGIGAASHATPEPLFGWNIRYGLALDSIPEAWAPWLRLGVYVVSLIVASAMLARWIQSNEQQWLKTSFIEILENGQSEESGEADSRSTAAGRSSSDGGAANTDQDKTSAALTANDLRREWDEADELFEPTAFMLFVTAISLLAIFTALFRSLYLDFDVFDVATDAPESAWIWFTLGKFLNSLPVLNIVDDFRSPSDAIKSIDIVGDIATGTAKFCFDFFVISIATSIVVGYAKKRRAQDFFGSDTLLGIIANCRDDKASGMLEKIAGALRATIDQQPENVEAIKLYAASIAAIKIKIKAKAKAKDDPREEAITYLKDLTQRDGRAHKEARRVALESLLLLIAPLAKIRRGAYTPDDHDMRIFDIWSDQVRQSPLAARPGGPVVSARVFLSSSAGLGAGALQQHPRYDAISQIRQRAGLIYPLPREIQSLLRARVAEVVQTAVTSREIAPGEAPSADASSSRRPAYVDAWLKSLVEQSDEKVGPGREILLDLTEAWLKAHQEGHVSHGDINRPLVKDLRDWLERNVSVEDRPDLFELAFGTLDLSDGREIADILQAASDPSLTTSEKVNSAKLKVDAFRADLLTAFARDSLKSYGNRPIPYLFERLAALAIEAAKTNNEAQCRLAQAVLLTAFRVYGQSPDVDLSTLNRSNRRGVAAAILAMQKADVAWIDLPWLTFINFDERSFRRYRSNPRKKRQLHDERRVRLEGAVKSLFENAGMSDDVSAVCAWIRNARPFVAEKALEPQDRPRWQRMFGWLVPLHRRPSMELS